MQFRFLEGLFLDIVRACALPYNCAVYMYYYYKLIQVNTQIE